MRRTPIAPALPSKHLTAAECEREYARARECADAAMFRPGTHVHEGRQDCWTVEETWSRFAHYPHALEAAA